MLTKILKTFAFAVALMMPAGFAAQAENVRVASDLTVAEATDRIAAAVEKSGGRVFAAVDYQKGAKSVGKDIRPTKLLILGGPKIGAGAFEVSQTIGLYTPLRVLAYEDADGQVWLMYRDPADAALEHGISPDHAAIKSMQAALKKLTGLAVATN